MGLRLRHTSLFLTYVLAPLCAISNFNYEQVNPRNFPAAMLLHVRLSFRKPVLPSPSSGLVHRAFPILCPILFLIYINDISNSTELNLLSFADDTTIYCSETTLDENRKKATSELSKILDWLHANRLSLNINKTEFTIIIIRSPM